MTYRKVRIAWSIAWGVLCLALAALWMRSYWRADLWRGSLSAMRVLRLSSQWGETEARIETWEKLPLRELGWHSHRGATKFRRWSLRGGVGMPVEQHGVKIPHLALVLATAGLAAIAWIRRYSVRTLLIVTTVVAALVMSVMSANSS